MACSRLSDSRDDAVKGVQKYERVNLRKGERWRFIFLFAPSNLNFVDRLSRCLEQARFFFFHHVHPQEKVYLTLTSLLYVFNFFRMLLGISTIVFYIFILVSYFRMRSEYALRNIP